MNKDPDRDPKYNGLRHGVRRMEKGNGSSHKIVAKIYVSFIALTIRLPRMQKGFVSCKRWKESNWWMTRRWI